MVHDRLELCNVSLVEEQEIVNRCLYEEIVQSQGKAANPGVGLAGGAAWHYCYNTLSIGGTLVRVFVLNMFGLTSIGKEEILSISNQSE